MAEQVPIDELPAYVQAEPGPSVQHTLEAGQVVVGLIVSVAGLVGFVAGLATVTAFSMGEGNLPYGIAGGLFMVVWMVGWTAFGEWRRRPVAERLGVTVALPDGFRVARAVLATPRLLVPAGFLLVIGWNVGVLAPEGASAGAGALLGAAVYLTVRFVQLNREARRTGWLRVLTRQGKRSRWRRTRSYLGDGMVIADLGWPVGLAAPRNQLDVSSLEPDDRWCVLSALGNHEAALAAITPACGPAEPTRALLAAVSLVLLDRPGEATVWIQRAVDDGFREKVHPAFAVALEPVHGTEAWKALKRRGR